MRIRKKKEKTEEIKNLITKANNISLQIFDSNPLLNRKKELDDESRKVNSQLLSSSNENNQFDLSHSKEDIAELNKLFAIEPKEKFTGDKNDLAWLGHKKQHDLTSRKEHCIYMNYINLITKFITKRTMIRQSALK